MSFSRSIAAMHLIALLLITVGCNKKSEETASATASIDGQSQKSTNSGSSIKKSDSDPLHPVVEIETTLGTITLALDAEKARQTVDNFLTYIKTRDYDQTIVHEVYKGQGLLAGGYGVDGAEKPAARTSIRNEAYNGLRNRRGTIAMVRWPDAIDSATSQFIINVADNPVLDHKDDTPEGYGYCVFGEVTKGMDVADRIVGTPVHAMADFQCAPVETIVVKSIRWIR